MVQIRVLRVLLGGLLFSCAVLWSCSDDIGTTKITREGSLTFLVNGVEWRAATFKVTEGPYVVVYVDQPNAGRPFVRHALIAQGTTPDGLIFQLSLVFDIKTRENFVGVYTPTYSVEGGGLNQIIINQETAKGSGLFTDYKLCVPQPPTSLVEIKRQSAEEKLVLGTFGGNLCLTGNSGQIITITGGQFTDISYDKDSTQ